MSPLQLVTWSLLALALALCALTDALWRRVPDEVTYPALGALLLLRVMREGVGGVEHGLLSGVLGAASAAILFAVLAAAGKMGWGDVKLMAVVGAGLGCPSAFSALVVISLVGAAQALFALLWRRALWETAPGRPIPYAVAIAAGGILTMWWEHSNAR